MSGEPYYTLLGSLPALPADFEQAERLPITWLGLERRLKMLSADDSAVLEELIDFLAWDRQSIDRTDEDVYRKYEQLR